MSDDKIINKTTQILERERQETYHSSDISHSSIHNHNDIICQNNKERILNIKIENNEKDFQDFSKFSSIVISKKFKEAIKTNIISPLENDNKTFKLKIFMNVKKNIVKERILSTLHTDDPNIKTFISESIDLILLKEMNTLNRNIVSLQENFYNKIIFKSKIKKKFLRSSYHEVTIDLLSIKFL